MPPTVSCFHRLTRPSLQSVQVADCFVFCSSAAFVKPGFVRNTSGVLLANPCGNWDSYAATPLVCALDSPDSLHPLSAFVSAMPLSSPSGIFPLSSRSGWGFAVLEENALCNMHKLDR